MFFFLTLIIVLLATLIVGVPAAVYLGVRAYTEACMQNSIRFHKLQNRHPWLNRK